jgi:hypothetical protein
LATDHFVLLVPIVLEVILHAEVLRNQNDLQETQTINHSLHEVTGQKEDQDLAIVQKDLHSVIDLIKRGKNVQEIINLTGQAVQIALMKDNRVTDPIRNHQIDHLRALVKGPTTVRVVGAETAHQS